MADTNGSKPTKKKKQQRIFVVLDKTNPERQAMLAALQTKFPSQTETAIIWAAVETFMAFVFTGADRVSRRDLMRILEDYWPKTELLPGELEPERKTKDRD